MDDLRIKMWEDTLRTRLSEEVEPNPRLRLRWLLDHLVDYFERFLGGTNNPRIPVKEVVENDLFSVLIAGMRLVESEVAPGQIPNFPSAEWADCEATIKQLNQNRSREAAFAARDIFLDFFLACDRANLFAE